MRRMRAKYSGLSSDPAALAGLRPCDHPSCRAAGEYRAPRSRETLSEYYWFCLDHVRAYNAAWDYYRGMGPVEIEAARRADTVGWRPSWPLGARFRAPNIGEADIREALRRFFDDADIPGAGSGARTNGGDSTHGAAKNRPATPEEEALAVMDLDNAATPGEIKARYKALVKRHHPDANGGDKQAEERLKSINQAYTVLKGQGMKLAVSE
ncbi:MAG: DnaJ domain-containing protein [Rhodospirillales bacterium]|nr:DnaJ domain-containing protein [Rhodospirillales bacterium]